MNFKERLTPQEAKVIRKFGKALRELASGIRSPQSTAQERFVRVCHGEEAPETVYEIAYMKIILREQALAGHSGKGQGSVEQKHKTWDHAASNQLPGSRRRRDRLEKSNGVRRSFEDKEKRVHKLVNLMLAKPVWLWGRDQRFLESIYTQLQEGRKLSSKQIIAIEIVYERFAKNQQPRLVRG